MSLRWSALPLALAVAFAGCSDGGGGDEDQVFEDLGLEVTETTGLVRGVVVDEAIRPVANATVTIVPGGQTATTPATGAFAFDGLEEGTYFLEVAKPGYKPAQASSDVVPGVLEPAIVKVVLIVDGLFVAPFYEQFVFEGFIECSMGGAAAGGYVYYSACSNPNPATGDPLFANDHFNNVDIVSGYPDWLQAEMVWESTQTVSRSLAHNIHYHDEDETDREKDYTAEGPSPLINTMNATLAKEFLEGLEFAEGDNLTYRQRIFTRATDGLGPAATIQQRFTVYTTLFYGYMPPEGWTFIESGEVPPPPRTG